MHTFISHRANKVQPSATIAVSNKAAEMKRAGRNVISLSAGEPDFDTPDFIKQAAVAAIEQGQTKYTAVDGTPDLKQAIIAKFKRDQGLNFEPNQIIVSNGAKHSLFNLLQAVINEGDEVLIPTPAWVSYVDMVKLCDGTPITISAAIEDEFKLSPDQLAKHITPKTKLLMLNSPSNPTGMVYSKQELLALADILKQHPNILIASDDIYEHISWSGARVENLASVCPELRDRTILVNGVSKAYAMTGWRIGYAAGPEAIIKTMKKLQSQNTSNPCSISQTAATAALNGDQGCLTPMVSAFHSRHDLVVDRLNAIDGFHCLPAQGAFYAFPDAHKLIQKLGLKDDIELAALILEKAEVATVPGSAFGAPGFIRLSYATSEAVLNEALDRLEQFAKRT